MDQIAILHLTAISRRDVKQFMKLLWTIEHRWRRKTIWPKNTLPLSQLMRSQHQLQQVMLQKSAKYNDTVKDNSHDRREFCNLTPTVTKNNQEFHLTRSNSVFTQWFCHVWKTINDTICDFLSFLDFIWLNRGKWQDCGIDFNYFKRLGRPCCSGLFFFNFKGGCLDAI